MDIRAHFEAIYDKQEFNPGNLLQNEVVVLRSCLVLDSQDSLGEVMQKEANKIFAADPMASRGYRHRIRIFGMELDGGGFSANQNMNIAVKMNQTA
ncbi:MAG: hypothetical protein V4606_04505 [Patescibacteria group bacterium]